MLPERCRWRRLRLQNFLSKSEDNADRRLLAGLSERIIFEDGIAGRCGMIGVIAQDCAIDIIGINDHGAPEEGLQLRTEKRSGAHLDADFFGYQLRILGSQLS